ncbi:MAG TPA: ring-cleaving dioxygenase [Thermoanaerobaculia bacterium]|jgi:glyoxalase family protein|nr:ring-cleaving dioxygenase [Thermoanaerobaculia bacterium]
MRDVHGLHHVTAIAGPAQENLDFYSGVLGMRLVKKSVNQDDPGTYHLFYADAEGHPGSDLTFFPWSQMAPARAGHGLASEVSLAVPPGSLGWWQERLAAHGVEQSAVEERFGEQVLPLRDPHGLRVALVESATAGERPFTPWAGSPVPVERQVRGLDGARLDVRLLVPSERFLADALGYREVGREGDWHRFGVGAGGSGRYLDLRETPAAPRGAWGTGTIHHLAFRVDDEEHQLAARAQATAAGARPTEVIDRFWFRSVYFKEPGGVLLELATDGPGFTVDETPESLGEALVLPPWLESHRAEIEQVLPPLSQPAAVVRG